MYELAKVTQAENNAALISYHWDGYISEHTQCNGNHRI